MWYPTTANQCQSSTFADLFILYMHVAMGKGKTTPLGPNFDHLIRLSSFLSIVANFRQIYFYHNLILIFVHYFMCLYCVRAGEDNSHWVNLEHHKNLLLHWSFAVRFRKNTLSSDFIQIFFLDFIHVYIPRAEADNPWRQNFYSNKNTIIALIIFYEVSLW